MELDNKELTEINGGGSAKWFIIGGIAVFIIGFMNGFIGDKTCKLRR